MNKVKFFVLFTAASLVSFSSLAQNVTARASTIDSAEAQIAAQAKKANADYKIIASHDKNGVYMMAKLVN
ncbi:DUF1471 domain-containing protein [Serratia sp. DD3]|uniref:DUF1471 domain-containing protein n=1 Tax=Serratia sp. DD3 TaxID=1410619 RepID=UPI0004D34927|nr:DUF1471 domain-containing protein [Serratia sp. DD3]KEY59217.1 hypothetical protein SRDD_19150 [Serratia sp. DD3]